MDTRVKLSRPKLLHTGGVTTIKLELCKCKDQPRSSEELICGKCSGAIPSDRERKRHGIS
jgi:hypothetical protein